jgi:hypothetical protein
MLRLAGQRRYGGSSIVLEGRRPPHTFMVEIHKGGGTLQALAGAIGLAIVSLS